MLISDLVKILEKYRDEYGDMRVYNAKGGHYDDPTVFRGETPTKVDDNMFVIDQKGEKTDVLLIL